MPQKFLRKLRPKAGDPQKRRRLLASLEDSAVRSRVNIAYINMVTKRLFGIPDYRDLRIGQALTLMRTVKSKGWNVTKW